MRQTLNNTLRIPRPLYEAILDDLRREHAHAYERVGFLFAKMGNAETKLLLLLATDYQPVPDDYYVQDPTCGAKIGSTAIRASMQRVLSDGECCFHVHMHEHAGKPRFGRTDSKSLPGVVRSLRNAGPKAAHGMLVFSDDHGIADVWLPGDAKLSPLGRIAIVGQPVAFFDRRSNA